MNTEKKLLKVSVTDLVLFNRNGDLLDESALNDPQDGIQGHQIVQKSRGTPYQAEVPVSKRLSSNTFDLELAGRIDGILTIDQTQQELDQLLTPLKNTGDLFSQALHTTPIAHDQHTKESFNSEQLTIVEEIKTHRQLFSTLSDDKKTLHLQQARLYGYLWASQTQLNELTIQLTYYNLTDETINILRHHYTFIELEAFFNHQTKAYIDYLEDYFNYLEKRNLSLKKLTFPFAQFRDNQRAIARQVYLACRHQKPLVLEAPTGSGKTMAVLFSGLKALGYEKITKCYFLTAKNAGAKAVGKAIHQLFKQGIILSVIHWVAKEKLCPLSQQCNLNQCPHRKGYYDRLKPARRDILNKTCTDTNAILEIAQAHQLCPHQLMFDLAPWVDLIIADYNYFFDPSINRIADKKNLKPLLLVDECHNLTERVRKLYSATLSIKQLSDALKEAPRQFTRPLKMIIKACNTIIEQYPKTDQAIIPKPLKAGLEQFSSVWITYLNTMPDVKINEPLLTISHQLYRLMIIEKHLNQQYRLIIDSEKTDQTLTYFCLDPGHFIADRYSNCALVLFSATLSPIVDYQQLLLADTQPNYIKLPGVFKPHQQRILIAPFIDVRYQNRKKTLTILNHLIFTVINVKPGPYLVFFPSYQYLQNAFEDFIQQYPEINTIRQYPGMILSQQAEFINAFKDSKQPSARQQSLIGFAVLGGLLGESIDLTGNSLIGAIVVTVNLPEKNSYNEAIKQYYQQRLKEGYDFAYRLPGINQVLQAVGRVIRTEHDKGIITLVDERFTHAAYRRLLPQDGSIQCVYNLNHLQQALATFWQSHEG